jgi:hypothetical protein
VSLEIDTNPAAERSQRSEYSSSLALVLADMDLVRTIHGGLRSIVAPALVIDSND